MSVLLTYPRVSSVFPADLFLTLKSYVIHKYYLIKLYGKRTVNSILSQCSAIGPAAKLLLIKLNKYYIIVTTVYLIVVGTVETKYKKTIKSLITSFNSVSYTHLDVYKRQVCVCV